jgi:hypothetical protein
MWTVCCCPPPSGADGVVPVVALSLSCSGACSVAKIVVTFGKEAVAVAAAAISNIVTVITAVAYIFISHFKCTC